MFGFLVLVLAGTAVWLLWNISRNTADALDKQTALQYEIVALEKRLDEMADLIRDSLQSPREVKAGPRQVDLNRAELEAFTTLPRIGKSIAQRIIAQRPYGSVDDVLKVQGVSQELLEEIRSYVTV